MMDLYKLLAWGAYALFLLLLAALGGAAERRGKDKPHRESGLPEPKRGETVWPDA